MAAGSDSFSPQQLAEWMWQRFLSGSSEKMFDVANEFFHLGLNSDQLTELIDVYRGHEPEIQVEQEAGAALKKLQGRAALGLLSDGFLPAQELKLEALKIRDIFGCVVFTETLGRKFWKPDPAGFRLITQKLGVEPEGCAYVADNLAKDFVAPNALGWRFDSMAPAGSDSRPQAGGCGRPAADNR